MFGNKLRLAAALTAMGTGCAGVPLAKEAVTEPGALLFNGYSNPNADCYHCHGGDGVGRFLHGPDLYNEVPAATDAEISETIHKGKSIMPAYQGKLSEVEIDTLTKWVRGKFGGNVPAPAASPAPAPAAAPAPAPSGDAPKR